MKKIKIKVFGTSANLGVGFDSFGIRFNIYNTYLFEESKYDELIGFKEEYQKDNLVLSSFKRFLKETNNEEINVRITEIEKAIPEERGLGSSSACIVAGVKAANYFLGNKYDLDTLINVATLIEGHPDNVLPALLGGLTAGFIDNEKVYYTKYKVSRKLHFSVLVPSFSLLTKEARGILPEVIAFKDAIDNLSKASNLGKLFEEGNIEKISAVTKSAVHEKYRLPLIQGTKKAKERIEDGKHIVLVSGAGPSLLVISSKNDDIEVEGFKTVKVKVK